MTNSLTLISSSDLDTAAQTALSLATLPRLGAAGIAAGFLSLAARAPTPFGAMQTIASATLAQAIDAARGLTSVGAAAGSIESLDTALQALQGWCEAGASVSGTDVANALAGARLCCAEERGATAAPAV